MFLYLPSSKSPCLKGNVEYSKAWINSWPEYTFKEEEFELLKNFKQFKNHFKNHLTLKSGKT